MPREVDSRPAPLEDPLHELLAWIECPRYKSLGKSQRRQNLKGGIAKVATGSQDSHKGPDQKVTTALGCRICDCLGTLTGS